MVRCNVCGWTGERFCALQEDENVFCPQCGSYERHRAIVDYLDTFNVLPQRGAALEIGPGPVQAFQHRLRQRGWQYRSIDLWPGFGQVSADTLHLPFLDRQFDLVVCFHVLEHVHDDYRAMEELARVAGTDALVLLQVPYDDQRFGTVENTVPTNESLRSRYYYDHKRDYGLDIGERCKVFWRCVYEVHPLRALTANAAHEYGYAKNYGTTFFCSNNPRVLPGTLRRDTFALKRRSLIERLAYIRFLSRNDDGCAAEDWAAAEAEVDCGGPELIDSVGPWPTNRADGDQC